MTTNNGTGVAKNMTLIAVVRTFTQLLVSKALATSVGVAIVTTVAEWTGFEITQEWLENIALGLIMMLVVWLANKFGKTQSWINRVLSWNLSRTGPAYVTNDADAVVSVANSDSADTVTTVDTPPPGPDDAGARPR